MCLILTQSLSLEGNTMTCVKDYVVFVWRNLGKQGTISVQKIGFRTEMTSLIGGRRANRPVGRWDI